MLHTRDTLGRDIVHFYYVESKADLAEVVHFVLTHSALGIDTESTGINCYRPDWRMRTLQIANADVSYVIPAKYRKFIEWLMRRDIKWIGHNGPHDMRCIDTYLGYETGIECAGETYIPAHHADSRKQDDGGIGHGLKEQAMARLSRDAGKWEVELKKAFKQIEMPIPGEVYKSGPRKGTQKMRKIKLSEGWNLIPPNHPAYIAYAAADPLLTYRLWNYYQPVVREFYDLYQFDKRVQQAGDKLTRRAMRLDVRYTQRLSHAYAAKATAFKDEAAGYGCANINSGPQIAAVLINLGVQLTARTEKGALKTDNKVLRAVLDSPVANAEAKRFIHCVLGAKQLLKRRESYTEQMLDEVDSLGRVHPSINTLAARTTRMSVSGPPLQQLPTANREDDAT